MKILKYIDIKEGESIEEEILENIVWCKEISAITSSPSTHYACLRIWYVEIISSK